MGGHLKVLKLFGILRLGLQKLRTEILFTLQTEVQGYVCRTCKGGAQTGLAALSPTYGYKIFEFEQIDISLEGMMVYCGIFLHLLPPTPSSAKGRWSFSCTNGWELEVCALQLPPEKSTDWELPVAGLAAEGRELEALGTASITQFGELQCRRHRTKSWIILLRVPAQDGFLLPHGLSRKIVNGVGIESSQLKQRPRPCQRSCSLWGQKVLSKPTKHFTIKTTSSPGDSDPDCLDSNQINTFSAISLAFSTANPFNPRGPGRHGERRHM